MKPYRIRSDHGENVKKLHCLKCDKYFNTTIERRICIACTSRMEAEHPPLPDNEKMYGNMGIFERKP